MTISRLRPILAIALWSALFAGVGRSDWRDEPFASSPEELRAAFAGLEPNKEPTLATLFRDVRIEIDAQRRSTVYERKIFRIDGNAALFSVIRAPWAAWVQERPVIRARVIALNGAVHEFDPATLSAASLPQMFGPNVFGDLQILQAPLPAVETGAIVELETRTVEHTPALRAGVSFSAELLDFGPVSETRMTLDAPLDVALRWRSFGKVEPEEVQREQGRRRVVEFRYGRVDSVRTPLTVQDDDRSRLEVSTADSWNAVARDYAKLVEDQMGPVPGDWPAAGASVRETAAALLAAVHERVRYTSVALGQAAIVPRSPAETLARRYGDCKDKSTLLVALLRERGIAAHVALLRTVGPDVTTDLPGFGPFNHAIVYIPGPEPLWIDPTDPYARVAELPAPDQGRWALVAHAETTELIRIPAAASEANRLESTRRATLSALGEGTITEREQRWGEFERQARHFHAATKPEDLVKALEDRADRGSSPKGRFRIVTLTPSDDLAGAFEREIETTFPDSRSAVQPVVSASFNGTAEVLAAIPPQGDKEDADAEEQPRPLSLRFAYSATSELRATPPPGYRARQLPQAAKADLGPAQFSEEFRLENDGTVVMVARFDSRQEEFEPEDAKRIQDEVARLRKRGAVKVEFDNLSGLQMSSGRFQEAIANGLAILTTHPHDLANRVQLVNAYLAAGGGLEAVAEAQRLVEDAPDSTLTHFTLGRALMTDQIGRPFHPGMDLEGARVALQRASELDGQAASAADYNLVLTFLMDSDGVRRYKSGNGASLEMARKLTEVDSSANTSSIYADHLMAGGDYQEILNLLEGVELTGLLPQYVIAATAAIQGVDAALEVATQRGGANAGRMIPYAGGLLIRNREYALGAGLQRRANTPDSSSLASADLYDRAVRHETVVLDPADPISVVKRWLIASHTAAGNDERITRWTSSHGIAELRSEAGRRAMQDRIERSMFDPIPNDTDADRRADEILARTEFQVEGDDAYGYRIEAKWQALPGRYPSGAAEYFVIREGGEYRLLDSTEDRALSDLGAEALVRLDAGNLPAAQRLLTWASNSQLTDWDEFKTGWAGGAPPPLELARMAAAALMASDPSRVGQAIEILLADKANLGDRDGGAARAVRLAFAYGIAGDQEQRIRWAREWLRLKPARDAAIAMLADALAENGRIAEAEAIYEGGIGQDEISEETKLNLRIFKARLTHDVDAITAAVERLEALGKATPSSYNDAAWTAVARGVVDDKALRAAEQANRLTGGQSWPILNTLAAAYAVSGQPDLARRTFLQSLRFAFTRKLSAGDWYVAGLVAEAYGLLDTARHAYGRADQLTYEARLPNAPGEMAKVRLRELN